MTAIVTSRIKEMDLMQKLAWIYAAMFFFTVALGYIPGFTNEEGHLFGLFAIELHDDILHLASGIWATIAGWYSARASIFYFKSFGIIYSLDGVLGLITGSGYLDGGIFFHDHTDLSLMIRLATNLPHILIGGIAIFIGFVLSRNYASNV